jgi:hypothetical protein
MRKSYIFWDIPPYTRSLLKINHPTIQPPLLDTCFTLVSCLAYSYTLKMEVTCSSEMSVDLQRTTECWISQKIGVFITTAVRTSNPVYNEEIQNS